MKYALALMSGHNLQNQLLAVEYEGKQKGQKRQNFRLFCPFFFFAFFVSTLPFTANPDFENVS